MCHDTSHITYLLATIFIITIALTYCYRPPWAQDKNYFMALQIAAISAMLILFALIYSGMVDLENYYIAILISVLGATVISRYFFPVKLSQSDWAIFISQTVFASVLMVYIFHTVY